MRNFLYWAVNSFILYLFTKGKLLFTTLLALECINSLDYFSFIQEYKGNTTYVKMGTTLFKPIYTVKSLNRDICILANAITVKPTLQSCLEYIAEMLDKTEISILGDLAYTKLRKRSRLIWGTICVQKAMI